MRLVGTSVPQILLSLALGPSSAPPSRHSHVAVMAATADQSRECSADTFAGSIEDAVFAVYGSKGTERVRQSLRALSDGVPLDRALGDSGHELMVQQANSYIESLTAQPWHDSKKHKWAAKLEQKWTVVRDELRKNLADTSLESRGNNIWGGLQADRVEYGTDWKTLPLCDRTVWDPVNAALFPKTCALLTKSKVPLIEAFFAKMPPHTSIKPHSDMCNFVLTSHLGVEVPEGECDLTVGDETVEWANGKVLLFDTSILHAAENRADSTRYILMMRVYHPELSALERRAMQLVFDCLDEPELMQDRSALGEYEERRRAVEAASRVWER